MVADIKGREPTRTPHTAFNINFEHAKPYNSTRMLGTKPPKQQQRRTLTRPEKAAKCSMTVAQRKQQQTPNAQKTSNIISRAGGRKARQMVGLDSNLRKATHSHN
ncbi:hypothetical protein L484_000090 [Morus notabilis]|uniref:Uncharacterized protein n=1 Tax=Morus notabilis TaxID=981085 RepID=W9T349_9ROSA|nr:hypothetical protein L484_000090 [Morus notabilis]